MKKLAQLLLITILFSSCVGYKMVYKNNSVRKNQLVYPDHMKVKLMYTNQDSTYTHNKHKTRQAWGNITSQNEESITIAGKKKISVISKSNIKTFVYVDSVNVKVIYTPDSIYRKSFIQYTVANGFSGGNVKYVWGHITSQDEKNITVTGKRKTYIIPRSNILKLAEFSRGKSNMKNFAAILVILSIAFASVVSYGGGL